MKQTLGTPIFKVERWLYQRGFEAPLIRRLMAVQILVAVVFLASGSLLVPWTQWPLAFGIGVTLASSSFWSITRTAQAYIGQAFTSQTAFRVFIHFSLRLLLTGVILFVLLIKLHTPLVPLLAGLTFTVACIVAWSVSHIASKPI